MYQLPGRVGHVARGIASGELVYAIRSGPDGPIKIGTTRHLMNRLMNLQCGSHVRLEVIWTVFGGRLREHKLHIIFGQFRIRGEWYQFGDMEPDEIRKYLSLAMAMRYPREINNLSELLDR